MCDQGNTLTFYSEKCKMQNRNTDILVLMETINPDNVYIFDKGNKEECCMGKIDES